MADKTLKAASVLAFERKLDPSDALFYAGNWDDRNKSEQWEAVIINEKAVRGTISNRLKTKGESDPAKLDAEVEKANLQHVDVAALPNNCDTLKVRFTLRILNGVGEPSACNNIDYRNKLLAIVKQYQNQHGFSELANRYAYNLANGRFLWRNRIGAEAIDIRIHHVENGKTTKTWRFDAMQYSLRNFNNKSKELAEASELIKSGLQGSRHVLLMIEAYVRIGEGQEVFPSQDLVLDEKKSSSKGQKSKILYDVNDIAAIHSQKIGNAIRTIDTWYQTKDEDAIGPIAVEPYGSVTTLGKAYRQPKEKMDFYSLFDNWILKDEIPGDIGNQHFVIATLIRGGVFGDSSKE
jgi:CRISPR-associated protein Csy3